MFCSENTNTIGKSKFIKTPPEKGKQLQKRLTLVGQLTNGDAEGLEGKQKDTRERK